MKLKAIHIIILIVVLIISCNSTKETTKLKPEKSKQAQKYDTIKIANDSIGYEIIILEVGFKTWLAMQKPRGYYPKNFLENKNRIFVAEYNSRVVEPSRFQQLYPFKIDYNNRTDYGYEVNYLLYNYFLFFQQKYNQNLKY